jgi:nucleotide-binding universal stress UspA family protein
VVVSANPGLPERLVADCAEPAASCRVAPLHGAGRPSGSLGFVGRLKEEMQVAIVVGYVPTKEGQAALSRAAQEAKLRDTSLVVVNSARGGRDMSEAEDRLALEALVADLVAQGIEVDLRSPVRGLEPAEDLIAIAEQIDAEFIVIGLRRRTPVGKLILGSNAQRILLDSPCPVLAVKAD